MMVKILYLLSTLLIIASAYKQTKTDVTVKLTPANFDKEVMRSKDIWFIMFSTKDCKHCTKVKGKFKLAASKMDGLVKFGEIDLSNESNGPLGRRFDIKGIPTINIFEYGLKNKRKSKTYEYTAKKEWKTLVTYATNLYEQSEKERGLVEIHELNKQGKWDRECQDNMYCVIVILPHISESNANDRKAYLATIKKIASTNKQVFQKYSWFWMQAGDQPEFMTHFNPDSYPVMIYSKSDKQMTYMKKMYTRENFQNFLDNLIIEGKANFVDAKYQVNFQTAPKWDGKDYFKVVQEREAKAAKKKAEKDKKKKEKEEKDTKAKEEKEKKMKAREEKRKQRKLEAEQAMAEPEEEEVKDDPHEKIRREAQEKKKKARKEKKAKEQVKEEDLDPELIDMGKLKARTQQLLQQTQHQMQNYQAKIPKKVVKLIEKDIERLGKAIERDPDNKIKLAKLVKKLDKDAMKIGEAIYANVDQSEIEKIEAEAKKMPEDAEVIKGIQEFLEAAITDVNTYADKIEKELVENIEATIKAITQLIEKKPIDKNAVEEGIQQLRTMQMKIGQSIYKQAEIAEKEKKAKEAREARGEDVDGDDTTETKPGEEEDVFEIDEDEDEEEDDDEDDDEEETTEEGSEETTEGEEGEAQSEETPASKEETKEEL